MDIPVLPVCQALVHKIPRRERNQQASDTATLDQHVIRSSRLFSAQVSYTKEQPGAVDKEAKCQRKDIRLHGTQSYGH